MNSTNRVLNRVLLFLGGIILIVGGAAALLWIIRPAWAVDTIDTARAQAQALITEWTAATVPVAGAGDIPIAVLVAFVIAIVLVILLLTFVFSRGGGTSREVHAVTSPTGSTKVDRNVVDALLTEPLAARGDVLSARTSVYEVKGEHTVRLAVTVRQGARLSEVLSAAERAVSEWDLLLGSETPVLIHLTDRSWADRLRSTARVR